MHRMISRWAVLVAAGGLAACAYSGDFDNPVTRKFSYFSYLNGDDLRAECAQGGNEKYRLVYNAVYGEQVRHYEVGLDESKQLRQVSRVVGAPHIGDALAADDLMAPWRGAKAEAPLNIDVGRALVDALRADGLFAPSPKGLELPSDGYWWLAMGCKDGRFYFNAWLYPDAGAQKLTFPAKLYAQDTTGITPAPPRLEPYPAYPPLPDIVQADSRFRLKVGEAGLVGVARLFK